MEQMKLGIVGCGNISDAYLRGGANSKIVAVKSVADINKEAADAKAETYGVASVSYDEMLADPDIGIVINLTVPQAHAEVTRPRSPRRASGSRPRSR
jgi:predicted dehydrogenase